MNNNAENQESNGMAELEDIVKDYVELNCALVAVGWGLWGDRPKDFSIDPLSHCYGAQKFYRRDGKLCCVSISLNVRDEYGMANIVVVNDMVIEGSQENSTIDDSEIVLVLDSITADDVATIINKYRDYKSLDVIVEDFEDECEYFMRHTGDGRVIFQNRSDENRQKPDHLTNRYHKLIHCNYRVEG